QIALLGLSFKHLTDDLRESPNVALAEILIGKGVDVRVHDPVVNMARLSGTNLRYVQAKLPHLQKVLHDDPAEALSGAHVAHALAAPLVAMLASAAPAGVAPVVTADPAVVIDLNGRLAPLEALPG